MKQNFNTPAYDAALSQSHMGFIGKVRLATAISIPFIGILAVGLGGTTYPLVYKVDVGVLSLMGIVSTLWNVANNFLIGYLQDKETLNVIFPKDSWGRRAPWVFVHTPISSVLIFFVWWPPTIVPTEMVFWAGAVLFLAQWTFSSIFIAALAVTTELFPFKEERVELDFYQLIWGFVYLVPFMLGASHILKFSENEEEKELIANLTAAGCNKTGDAASYACYLANVTIYCDNAKEELNNDDEETQIAFEDSPQKVANEAARDGSFLWSLIVASGLMLAMLSVGPMSQAKASANPDEVGSGMKEIKELEQSDSFSNFMVYSAIDAISYSIEPGFYLFYLTYVVQLTPEDRSFWFLIGPLISAFTQAAMGVVWVHLFSKKQMNPTPFLVWGLVIDSLMRPILIELSTGVELFMVQFVIGQIVKSPRVYWDTSVRGWVVDEDTQANPGKRREGIIVGFRSTIRTLANVGVQMLFIGMVVSGIDTRLPDVCPQADFGIRYIRLMFQLVLPLCQIYQLGIINNMPIKGARLEKLIANQKDETPESYGIKVFQSAWEAAEAEVDGGFAGAGNPYQPPQQQFQNFQQDQVMNQQQYPPQPAAPQNSMPNF